MKHRYSFAKQFVFFFLLVLCYQMGHAQALSISGKITDSITGKPVISASITVRNKNTSAATKTDGTFTIQAALNDELTISYVGYNNKTVVVNGSFITVEIAPATAQLNDVVVTALGIRKEVKRIGYSVQEVKGEDLVKARDQNPITGLTGKVAGLSVGPSAELLRKPTVLLRGNEITLYVVDGIPISSDTWNISPDDIESYTILKGPSAAALYGSRAQYGAILITTKKGNKRKGFAIEINSTNSIDAGYLAFPRTQDLYGAGENTYYQFVNGKGGAPGGVDGDYDVWGPYFNGQLIPQYDSPVDPATGIRQGTPYVARGKNNLKRFLRTGFQTTDNIALSASGDNYSVRLSASHSYQQSTIPNNWLNITNFNMYTSYNPTKRLRIEANMNYNRQYTPNFPDVDYGPNSLIYNIGIWTGADWDVEAPDIKGEWQPGKVGTQSVFAEYQRYHNPWFQVNEWLRGHYKNDLYGYLSANYKIDDHINTTVRTQVTTYDLLRTEKMPYSAHPYGREGNQGDYREDRRSLFENNTEVLANYNYTVKKSINLSGLVGGNIRTLKYNSDWTSTDYLNVPGVYSFSNSKNPIQASSFSSDLRVLSAYYSLDVSLGKYATISTTGRVDKTSALNLHNSYYYPSLSVALPVSDYVRLPTAISFLKVRGSYATVHGDATSSTIGPAPFNSISALGASPSGNSLYDNPLGYGSLYQSPYGGPDYSLASVYSTSKPYNNQTAAYYTSNLYDPNLKTFNRVNYEAGLDVRFIKNRLGFSATGFEYIDGPRILQNPVSSASGFNYYYINALKTKKTGLELSLTGTPIKSKSLIWDVLINWSTFQDKFTDLPPGQLIYNGYYVTDGSRNQIKQNAATNGTPDYSSYYSNRVDAFYGSKFVRTTDGQIINDAGGKPLSVGGQKLGYLNADFAWSVYNKFNYQGISLGFQFDGSVGGVTVDYMRNKTMRGGRNIETVEGALGEARYKDWLNYGPNNNPGADPAYKGSYIGEGVQISNNGSPDYNSTTGEVTNYKNLSFTPNATPVLVQDYVSKYYNVDEANLMSKTFAKLREVTLGYDLPAALLKGTFMSKVSLSLVGRNLLYFYKDKRFKDVDLDQYNYATSSTQLQSPTVRRYGFNVNIVF